MKRRTRIVHGFLLAALSLSMLTGLPGCDEGGLEDVGEEIDEGMEEIGDEIDDAT